MLSACYNCGRPEATQLRDPWITPGGGGGGPGLPGPAGTITILQPSITGAPGTNASVANTGTPSAAILRFTIPRGDTGAAGQGLTVGSNTPPASPQAGDLWTTIGGELFIWMGLFWKQIG